MGRDASEVRGQDRVYGHSLELVTLLHCKLLVTKRSIPMRTGIALREVLWLFFR